MFTVSVLIAALLHDAVLAVVEARGALLWDVLGVAKSMLESSHGTRLTSPRTTLVAKIHVVETIVEHLHTVATVVGRVAVGLHGRSDASVSVVGVVLAAVQRRRSHRRSKRRSTGLESRSLSERCTVVLFGLGGLGRGLLSLAGRSVKAVLVAIVEGGVLTSRRNELRTRTLDSARRCVGVVGGVCAFQSGNVVGRVRALQLGNAVCADHLGRGHQSGTFGGEATELDFERTSVGGRVLGRVDLGQNAVERGHGSLAVSRLTKGTGRKALPVVVAKGCGSVRLIVRTVVLGRSEVRASRGSGKLHALALTTNENGELVVVGVMELEVALRVRRGGLVLHLGRLVVVLITEKEAGSVDRSEHGRQFSHLARH